MKKYILLLATIFCSFFISCSNPSSIAKKKVIEDLNNQYGNFFEVSEFKNDDAVELNESGVKLYDLKYSGKIICTKECNLTKIMSNGFVSIMNQIDDYCTVTPKGLHYKLIGEIMLEKHEQGWVVRNDNLNVWVIPGEIVQDNNSSVQDNNSSVQDNNNGFQKKDGFEYSIIKKGSGVKKPQIGDIVEINFEMRVGDSVIVESRQLNNNQPVQMQLATPNFRGDWTSGMALLTVGDSAIFRISADTIKKGTGQIPSYIRSGQKIEYRVSVVSIKTKDEIKSEMNGKENKQKQIDDRQLQEYFTRHNIHPIKTASGLYYTIEREGKGENPRPGQQVTVNYTGTLLNGEKFDSNIDASFNHVQPFTFPLGQKQVIEGWDQGIALLKKDSKATLYVPSQLAYGPQARSEKIGPNSILIFKVELVDFK